MQLTLRTDYALRVLIFSAIKGDALSTVNEIVSHFDISKGHVMKVVHGLGRKGYLETIRGKNGGIRLARKSSQINVGAVVRDMEEELGVLGCLQGERHFCRIEDCCVLRRALREATSAFLSVLDRFTIEDLVGPRRPLARMLKIDATAPAR